MTLDLWAGKSDSLLRQMSTYVNIVPPEDAQFDGLDSVELTLTVSLAGVNEPVEVTTPESVRPWSELQGFLGGTSGSDLPMPFMEGMGSGGMLEY
jgi:hypothetical protein